MLMEVRWLQPDLDHLELFLPNAAANQLIFKLAEARHDFLFTFTPVSINFATVHMTGDSLIA